jgi:IS5 family transposase
MRERLLSRLPSARNIKILSVFETTTEVIRKGKASKPTEFGKMIKIQEAACPFGLRMIFAPESS